LAVVRRLQAAATLSGEEAKWDFQRRWWSGLGDRSIELVNGTCYFGGLAVEDIGGEFGLLLDGGLATVVNRETAAGQASAAALADS
jgi:hypothetical protein